MTSLRKLSKEVSACEICREHLPLGPRPLFKIHARARILVIGQAPGRKAHESGIPWNDPSGDRLRDWLGVSRQTFYDHAAIALMPMGFCYPGTGKGGDLAPRPECREAWHAMLLSAMPAVELTLLIGRYALDAYLPAAAGRSVTAAVEGWRESFPSRLPLPHPSPRNNRWLKKNPWFERDVLPELRATVERLI